MKKAQCFTTKQNSNSEKTVNLTEVYSRNYTFNIKMREMQIDFFVFIPVKKVIAFRIPGIESRIIR